MATLELTADRLSTEIDTFTVEQAAGKHDLLVATVNTSSIVYSLSDRPVRVSYSSPTEVVEFHGYIDTPVEGVEGADGTLIAALSASVVMRSGSPRVWHDATAMQIASDIVRPHGFSLDIDNVEGRFGFFAQSSSSDWETLNKLASECGLILHSRNSLVRLTYPERAVRRTRASIIPKFVTSHDDVSFEVAETVSPIGYEGYVFRGRDSFGQEFAVRVNDDAPVQRTAAEEVSTLADALAAADRVRRRSAAQRRANLRIPSMPNIMPGHCVFIDEGTTSGVWFVLQAVHRFGKNRATTELGLCLPTFEDTTVVAVPPTRVAETHYLSGRWRANGPTERFL